MFFSKEFNRLWTFNPCSRINWLLVIQIERYSRTRWIPTYTVRARRVQPDGAIKHRVWYDKDLLHARETAGSNIEIPHKRVNERAEGLYNLVVKV